MQASDGMCVDRLHVNNDGWHFLLHQRECTGCTWWHGLYRSWLEDDFWAAL